MANHAAPSQTRTPVDAVNIARGELVDERDGMIDLAVPGTDYRLTLVVGAPLNAQESGLLGKKICGVIRAQAKRIDVVGTGGRYVEPVYGRPRRIQGVVVATDPNTDTVTVQAHDALPIVCRTNELQHASDFKVGQFVTMGLAAGATFSRVISA
ncbi:MAG: hypothetical protein ACTS22_10275 [Phycisphaerales bacterium]